MNRLALAGIIGGTAALLTTSQAAAQGPANAHVEEQVDQITKDSAYDWLRSPQTVSDGSTTLSPSSDPSPRKPEHARPPNNWGCDFEPTPPSRQEQHHPLDTDKMTDCGAGPTTGESPKSTPDCGFQPSSCDCGNIGGQPIAGGCGCGGIGAPMTTMGYLMGAVFLLGLVFFVAWFSLKRGHKREKKANDTLEQVTPGEVDVSSATALLGGKLLSLAKQAAASGDFKQAVGWAYLSGLGSLHRGGFTDLGPSTTNLHIIESIRHRNGPLGATQRLVRIFEELFFGGRQATVEAWETCRQIVEVEIEAKTEE